MIEYNDLLQGTEKIAVIGLGYVGLPLAVALGNHFEVLGFDIDELKISQLRKGHDATGELNSNQLADARLDYTTDEPRLKEAKFFIVTVPTPIDSSNKPDLSPLESASRMIGRNLSKGSVVVYESTVYPGVTEEVCAPILEAVSGLKCGSDFTVGYSPERINPGDKVHTVDKIIKVVSGQDAETLDIIARLYERIVTVGVHRASSIKVAEAAKVIENTQRDLNIALMNELALIFGKLGISTKDVLAAAGTKWNFLPFTPGLVGGHCIGVDPYYLTHKAEAVGYHPQVILAGRRINDNMGKHIAETTVKKLIQGNKAVKGARVLVLGLTFKEDVPDIRNTKVIDIVRELTEYGADVIIHDPVASVDEVHKEHGIGLTDMKDVGQIDAIVLAVAHHQFRKFTTAELTDLFGKGDGQGAIIDVKGLLDRSEVESAGLIYWSL